MKPAAGWPTGHDVAGEVRHSARARADLIDIWFAVAVDDPVAADRVLDRLAQRVGLLRRFPQAGTGRVDIAEDARILVERPYLIFYRLVTGGVQIVRIVHGSRDLTTGLFAEGIE